MIVCLCDLGSRGNGFESNFPDVSERRGHEKLDGEVSKVNNSSSQSTSHCWFCVFQSCSVASESLLFFSAVRVFQCRCNEFKGLTEKKGYIFGACTL